MGIERPELEAMLQYFKERNVKIDMDSDQTSGAKKIAIEGLAEDEDSEDDEDFDGEEGDDDDESESDEDDDLSGEGEDSESKQKSSKKKNRSSEKDQWFHLFIYWNY